MAETTPEEKQALATEIVEQVTRILDTTDSNEVKVGNLLQTFSDYGLIAWEENESR